MQTLKIAHRGYSKKYPENTLESFTAGFEGADGIELDVHVSKDGQLIVMHDETVNRTTNGKGFIKDLTLKELKALDAGSWKHTQFKGIQVPTLEEVLVLAQRFEDKWINIEVKTDVFDYEGIEQRIIDLINQMKIKSRIVLSSFNFQTLLRFKTLDQSLKLGYLVSNPNQETIKNLRQLKPQALHSTYVFGLNLQPLLEELGIDWRIYTINNKEEYQYLVNQQINWIFTDDINII